VGGGLVNRDGEGGQRWWMYETRTLKLVEMVLRWGGGMRRKDGGVNLIVSTYINVTMYPPCTTIICK
jgi:hypothetical protein